MKKKQIMDSRMIKKVLERIAHEIVEKHLDLKNVVFVGIKRRGEPLSVRLKRYVENISDISIPVGSLDITLYRDDLSVIGYHPVVRETNLNFDINGKDVFLVDDVLFTGRTVRAALDELVDFGRPASIKLVVLIDRGNREFPICPDYVGRKIDTEFRDKVEVNVKEIDGKDEVFLIEGENNEVE